MTVGRINHHIPNRWSDKKIAIIGEAPGQSEMATGVPFSGQAGRELDRWLNAVGLNRNSVFLGNLSTRRPPNNDLSLFFDGKTPKPELQEDIDNLTVLLKTLQPNIIITLGNWPLWIFAGVQGVFDYWGSLTESTLMPGFKLMPLPHPAFVIRGMWRLRPVCITFLERACQEADTPEMPADNRTMIIQPTADEAIALLQELQQKDKFAFDIEDPGGDLVCIGYATSPDWSCCIPMHGYLPVEQAEIWRQTYRLLRNDALKIGHNLMYDTVRLSRYGFCVNGPYWDTMVGNNRLYPDLSSKTMKKLKMNRLSVCAAIYCRDPRYWKNDYKTDNKTGNISGDIQVFYRYNCKDVLYTYEVCEAERRELQKFGLLRQVERDMQCFPSLIWMSIRGILRDVQGINDLRSQVQQKLDDLDRQIHEFDAVPPKFNPGSPKQTQELLYSVLKLPPRYKTNTVGKKVLSTDELALAGLEKYNPVLIRSLRDWRRLSKFSSSYLDVQLSPDNRTRTTYNNGRTSTFRLSSSESLLGGGMNLQTIPSRPRPGEDLYNDLVKKFKKTFIADPGKLLVKRDYKQAEAVYVAYASNDLPLIADFKNGVDIHCRTASYIYGIDYETLYQRYLDGDPDAKAKRRFAKPVRHGTNYKMSWKKLQELYRMDGIEVSAADCKSAMEAVLSASPWLRQWHAEVEETIRTKRVITNAFGHQYRFFGIIDDDAVREALAFGPQSTVGLMTQYAAQRIYDEYPQCELLLNIHDALIVQCDESLVDECIETVGRLMEIPLTLNGQTFTIESDAAFGPSWGELREV